MYLSAVDGLAILLTQQHVALLACLMLLLAVYIDDSGEAGINLVIVFLQSSPPRLKIKKHFPLLNDSGNHFLFFFPLFCDDFLVFCADSSDFVF